MSVGELSGAAPGGRLDALIQSSPQSGKAVRDGSAHLDVSFTPDGSSGRPTPGLPERVGSLPSSAIHELRTPLTSIHGYAQILQRSLADNPKAHAALSVIVRESARLTQMLSELSDVVELDSPATAPARSSVDLRAS